MTAGARPAAGGPAVSAALRRGIVNAIGFPAGPMADTWGVYRDAVLLRHVVKALARPFAKDGITHVVGLEAAGFLLGGAVAVELNAGFVPVRKDGGRLAGATRRTRTRPDYRGRAIVLHLQRHAFTGGERVILVDDWFETGNQALATVRMLRHAGAVVVGTAVIVDELRPRVAHHLGRYHHLVAAAELNSPPAHGLARRHSV